MDNLKDLALYEYFSALSADEPVPEAIAVRLDDGTMHCASTLTIWNAEEKQCLRLSADRALFDKMVSRYDSLTQPAVFQRVHVKHNEHDPRNPHIELS